MHDNLFASDRRQMKKIKRTNTTLTVRENKDQYEIVFPNVLGVHPAMCLMILTDIFGLKNGW